MGPARPRSPTQLIALIGLIRRTLPADEARPLLLSHASGTFFLDAPMLSYGGSVLSYVVAFEMPDAVRALLATGLVSLNDTDQACKLSGFLPIHAVIANR